MRKWVLAIGIVLCISGTTKAQKATYNDMVNRYIGQYREMAIAEQKRSGVPAAVTLAQGIHETVAGSSRLATMANNHFGIKCKKEWTGETFKHTDDAPDECFRKYASAAVSYQDHSDYLVKSPRYANLFKLDVTDYEGWATGLKKAGYATNPQYAQALIKLIEDYSLQTHTYAALGMTNASDVAVNAPGEVVPEHDAPVTAAVNTAPATPVIATSNIVTSEPTTPEVQVTRTVTPAANSSIKIDESSNSYPAYGQVTRINGLKAVYAKKGDTPLEYAFKHDIRYERLLEINDISDRPLPFDMYLYLERKNFTGNKPSRTLKQGETLLQLAQEEGVQLKFMRAMNLLEPGEEPIPGSIIELQHRAKQKPDIIPSTAAKPQAPQTQVAAAATPVATETTPAVAEKNNTAAIAEQVAATQEVLAPANTDTAIPVPAEKTELVAEQQPVATPPAAEVKEVKEIKKTEEVKETVAEVAPVAVPPVATAPAAKQPAVEKVEDELDALKAKFDKVIYSNKPAEAANVPQTVPAQAAPKATEPSGDPKYYMVKKGDTAFSIAKRNNITMTQLMDWNSLNFGEIKVGQKLRVQ